MWVPIESLYGDKRKIAPKRCYSKIPEFSAEQLSRIDEVENAVYNNGHHVRYPAMINEEKIIDYHGEE